MDLMIADLQISAISDAELEEAFRRVLIERKDAVASIQQSMKDADAAYRKYLRPGFEPIEEEARKDRAVLNKAEKNIAEKFAALKEAYERPLEPIEMNIKEIRKTIKKASGQVDAAVKAYEEEQKSEKREEIQAYFDGKKFELVPLDKIFDRKWLDKGTKMRDVKEQIDGAIAGTGRSRQGRAEKPGASRP
jgi:DNA repair exonuclease SbcCD ATPase subunit